MNKKTMIMSAIGVATIGAGACYLAMNKDAMSKATKLVEDAASETKNYFAEM